MFHRRRRHGCTAPYSRSRSRPHRPVQTASWRSLSMRQSGIHRK